MLTVCCWSWAGRFGPEYVNRLRAGLARHLHIEHELVVVTDSPTGIDRDVRIVPLPTAYAHTPRCRRRMQQFSRDFARDIGATRILGIDLDVVIVDDLTAIVNRPEPIVCWKVKHAQVYSGSFVLFDAGFLDGAWQRFADDPESYPRSVQPRGVPSDQAMLNHYLAERVPIPYWTEADGFVTYFGKGYEHIEHFGVGPHRKTLPEGARIVVLGSADKAVMDEGRFKWIRENWIDSEVHA